jgi:hypothetical protein
MNNGALDREGTMMPEKWIAVRVPVGALDAAVNCLEASATDEREPERYREWYAESAQTIRAAMAEAASRGEWLPAEWWKSTAPETVEPITHAEATTPQRAAELRTDDICDLVLNPTPLPPDATSVIYEIRGTP